MVDSKQQLLYNIHMNEYNYRYVIESVLPRTKKANLIDQFMERYESPKWRRLLDSKLNTTQQMQILQHLADVDVFSGMKTSQERSIWNVYCFANWGEYWFDQAEVDAHGYIKYKDIGYEPIMYSEHELDQCEPEYQEYNGE